MSKRLESLKSPSDLAKYSYSELDDIAQELMRASY